jgi:pyruvate/2-oxoglutarate dehydrogenase complex dihydrolipoamide acyltransferase (E2) component
MLYAGRSAGSVPSSVPLRIPKLALAMTEATFVEWLVEEGAIVSDGQALYLVETDKVETEVPAIVGGMVHQAATPGEVYAVGTEIGRIDVDH